MTSAFFPAEILECASDPCLNDATCVEQVNGYECQCPEGFVGTNCETGNYSFCFVFTVSFSFCFVFFVLLYFFSSFAF